jgi:uncharacterized membrane protein (GlpM family)
LESGLLTVVSWINGYIIPLIIGIAVVWFLIALVKFVANQGDEEKRKEARSTMIWGIVAIFVMVSVWGLVNVLQNTFGLDNSAPTELPEVPLGR